MHWPQQRQGGALNGLAEPLGGGVDAVVERKQEQVRTLFCWWNSARIIWAACAIAKPPTRTGMRWVLGNIMERLRCSMVPAFGTNAQPGDASPCQVAAQTDLAGGAR